MDKKMMVVVFMLLVHVTVAVRQQVGVQQVSVLEGTTAHLRCPIINAHQTKVEWQNPDHDIMFFSRQKGEERNFNHEKMLHNKRYSIVKLSHSEFTVSISDVTFRDGGVYTCRDYSSPQTDTRVELIVLGRPRMSVTKHDGKPVIKCTAEANRHAPQISWNINDGPEIHGKSHYTTTTTSSSIRPPATQELPRTASPSRTTTPGVTPTPPQSSTVTAPPVFTLSPVLSKDSYLSTTDDSRTSVSPVTTSRSSEATETETDATSPTGWISVPETTEDVNDFNSTDGNITENNSLMRATAAKSSTLLVILVTFLIVCLLVVVIFFTIKLRKAHIAWKRENEDSDPSEDSSKSKSSQDEKSTQGQRRRGLINTAFTQYVMQEPTVNTSVINTAAMETTENVNKEQTVIPEILRQTSANRDIKETEL